MDTNEQIRQLEASLSKEFDEIKNSRRKLEIQELEYSNKLKCLEAILNKGAKSGTD